MAEGRTLLLAAGLAVSLSALTTTWFLARQPAPDSMHGAVAVRTAASETAPPAPRKPTTAEVGRDVEGRVGRAKGSSALFLFVVPQDAVEVVFQVRCGDGDVSLRAASGAVPPDRDADWDWKATMEEDVAKVAVTRHADADLVPGPVVVEITPDAPSHRKDAADLAFTVRCDAKTLVAPREVTPGRAIDAATTPGTGHRADFFVDVPPGTDTVRIDVLDAEGDVDVLASQEGPALDPDDAAWDESSMVARESLVIGAASKPPLAAGKLWFGVVDPSIYDAPVRFRLVVTFGGEPPPEATVLPELKRPADPRDLAVASVVEVVVDDGVGSGTIVSADGLVLTARHVVGERTGRDGRIVVALDLDPTQITRDLFCAEVVKSDEDLDLALLRITSGLRGRALPADYRFPVCPIAFDEPLRLGDPLETIGFPEPAGAGTRAPVMFSTGVVSGFDREKAGLRIKTDAFVASGSSGGAALDAKFRLVGVPVFTITESDGTSKTGFLVPVSEVPKAWRELIGASPR
jgi:S1-C subfamily serine protease